MKRNREELVFEEVINNRFELNWPELEVLVLLRVQLQISLVFLEC